MITIGTVLSAGGGLVSAYLPAASLGEGVRITTPSGAVTGVVTSLRERRALIATHDAVDGVAAGDAVAIDPAALTMPLGMELLGRAIDSHGAPLDGGVPLRGRAKTLAVSAAAPSQRRPIDTPFWTGIRAIDALLTIGRGARIGIFGPPGCGKSTLLHLLMRGAFADAVVVALVGERGREAEEWMRLCPQHASVVCATGDRSAAQRVHAARVAIAQAHTLRSRGLHVLLILDSLARLCAALREVAIASGESAGRGGYPPSVFADLARLVEIPGNALRGSITMVATVLSEGDDRDPVGDAVRSLLDGHIALSPKLAHAGRFPAIDLLGSVSRTMTDVAGAAHVEDARITRAAIAVLAQTEDARSLGIAPVEPGALRAIAAEGEIESLLRQGKAPVAPAHSLTELAALADTLR